MYHPLTSHSEHDASAAGHAQAAAHAAAVWPSRLRPQDVAWAHHPWSAQPPAPQLSQRACAYWPALHTYDGMDTTSHRTQYWPEHHTAAGDAAYVAQCPSPYVIPAVSHSGFTDSWVHTDAGDVPNRSVAPCLDTQANRLRVLGVRVLTVLPQGAASSGRPGHPPHSRRRCGR